MKGYRFAKMPLFYWIAVAAILCAGAGCSAPDDDERARFGIVTGFVLDADNDPIAGAQVRVIDQAPGAQIGTRNYFGERGPFVANARGQFRIEGVQLSPGDQVVLNLEVTHPGFLPGFATSVAPLTVQIGDGFLVAGERSRDILVQAVETSDVIAVLQRVGSTSVIGHSGGEITAPVPQPSTVTTPPAVITVRVPQGALATAVPVSLTPLTPSALVATTAHLPSTLPTPTMPAVPGRPISVSTDDPIDLAVVTPFSAFDFSVGGSAPQSLVFPAGNEPSVLCPLPISLPAGTRVPVMEFVTEPITRGRAESKASWRFVTDGIVGPNGRVIEFKISRPGIYAAATELRWSLLAVLNDSERQVQDFNPLTQFPQGYLATSLSATLTIQGLNDSDHPAELAFIRSALAAILDDTVHGPIRVVVPPGDRFGIRCTPVKRDIGLRLIVGSGEREFTYNGLWRFWRQQQRELPPLQQIPPHLQGHVQGGGVER
ncbi:MAG: hypothetical protein GX785_09910 [Armatimonadetes bacterium]|nr:hypothetical protein [Armatimonadota bacterium]